MFKLVSRKGVILKGLISCRHISMPSSNLTAYFNYNLKFCPQATHRLLPLFHLGNMANLEHQNIAMFSCFIYFLADGCKQKLAGIYGYQGHCHRRVKERKVKESAQMCCDLAVSSN